MLQLANMAATIRGNEVRGFNFGGIGVDRVARGGVVSANRVIHCGYGTDPTGFGIGVAGPSAEMVVERNEVVCGEHGPGQWSKFGVLVGTDSALIRSNIISGAAAFSGIALITYSGYSASGCTVYANRLRNLVAGMTQVLVDTQCSGNNLIINEYGGLATGGRAGVLVRGANNQFSQERFWGSYPGLEQPCVWLETTSTRNRVSQLKYGSPAHWAVCTRVRDEGWGNIVEVIERCPRK